MTRRKYPSDGISSEVHALPAEPGGRVSTPVVLSMSASADGAVKAVGSSTLAQEIPVLSLWKLAPPGFLTQSFAVDLSAGCAS